MKIIYPYNEILPTKKAHDVFIFNECIALSKKANVTLLCGKGSKGELFKHYQVGKNKLQIRNLPILRKNFFKFSWNYPFFFSTQKYLKKTKPDVAIFSVMKQGEFHFQRKIRGIRYVYEVHELQYYPDTCCDPLKFEKEKKMLEKADLIITTTQELATILRKPPYELKVPIHVLHLAGHGTKLPLPLPFPPFKLGYVGQLYKAQGISMLLQALKQTSPFFHLKIIGGSPLEISHFKKEAALLNIENRVEFLGFQPPKFLPQLLNDVHAFVAPFEAGGKMSYVAHTKLIEYRNWGRPVIAPNLNVVKECFPGNRGVLYFEPDNVRSLANMISSFDDKNIFERLLAESQSCKQDSHYNWDERALNYLSVLSEH